MLNALFDLARPALFALDPETAHEAAVRALELGVHPRDSGNAEPSLRCRLGRLELPSPIGIAAGFDKDARVPDAVLAIGCGFAEVGTLTPRPQVGNPKPRLFRLIEDRAVINRYGFNNCGHEAALARLVRRPRNGIVGVNIGANKDAADRTADYVAGLEAFYDVASYFTVNISSPNTPGLRDLQAPAALDELLGRVMAARAAKVAEGKPERPIVVKIAPDIAEDDIAAITAQLEAHKVDAIAVSNTTLARPSSFAQSGDRQRSRRAVGTAGVPPLDRDAGARASGDRRPRAADRGRRHRQRPDRTRQARGRRLPAAALYGNGFRGPRPDRPHQGASRRGVPSRGPVEYQRADRTPRGGLGRQAARSMTVRPCAVLASPFQALSVGRRPAREAGLGAL